jgi:hypothetical protein
VGIRTIGGIECDGSVFDGCSSGLCTSAIEGAAEAVLGNGVGNPTKRSLKGDIASRCIVGTDFVETGLRADGHFTGAGTDFDCPPGRTSYVGAAE